MLNISKILEKHKKDKEKKDLLENSPTSPVQSSKKDTQTSVINPAIAEKTSEKEAKPLAGQKPLNNTYSFGLQLAEDIYNFRLAFEKNFAAGVDDLANKIIQELQNENKELLFNFFQDYFPRNNYLYSHVLNSCILSLELGLGLGLSRQELLELGMASFLHDVGLIRYSEIIARPSALTPDEKKSLHQHPLLGVELLKKNNSWISGNVLNLILQVYEHVDGSGYPYGLAKEAISENAQLIGLAQTYENLTHSRPWREKFTPPFALEEILRCKHRFFPHLIKALVQGMGFYPYGSKVLLNTNESASVIKINPDFPLSPIVKVTTDSTGRELSLPKVINLAESKNTIYIEKFLGN